MDTHLFLLEERNLITEKKNVVSNELHVRSMW